MEILHTFDLLDPHSVLATVESLYGLRLDGSIERFTSYINRVYGLCDEDGNKLVFKVFRPGRWTARQLLAEQAFVGQCFQADLPVILPLADLEGETLLEFELESGTQSASFFAALYPRKSGRSFDAERQEDWQRLGSLVGRMHMVARSKSDSSRPSIHPLKSTLVQLDELGQAGLIHPDFEVDFLALGRQICHQTAYLFEKYPSQRLHGDCHRGNLLERGSEGLLLIDFDDMANGPAVQDLWLLLPGRKADSPQELSWLIAAYSEFAAFDQASLELIEVLRFMRMIHYLAWCAAQRQDLGFLTMFGDWSSRAFWLKELEDLRSQHQVLVDEGLL